MDRENLKKSLCQTFCNEICITPVPVGWAISGLFEDGSGDPVCFYMTETADGIAFEDDGDFLAEMVARNIDIEQGRCDEFLSSVLSSADADWDKNTFQIKSNRSYTDHDLSTAVLKFLIALVRVRDISFFTREVTQISHAKIKCDTQDKKGSYLDNYVKNHITNPKASVTQHDNIIFLKGNGTVSETRIISRCFSDQSQSTGAGHRPHC